MAQSDETRIRFKASLWDGCRYGEDAQSSRIRKMISESIMNL